MTPELERALQSCASEPIHLSGAIQPHGYLISCRLPDWSIHHVSANIEALTGAAPEDMLRHSLREFITGDVIQTIAETVGFADPGAPAQRAAVANIGPMATLCEVSVHAIDGLVHIEIEPQQRGAGDRSPTVVAQAMIARVAAGSEDEGAFRQRVVEQVRLLTGYDRVMVYRFRHDDSGEVVAEARDEDMPSYLGLRYPASDIPAQARRLYLHNRIRVIPDARYAPVPVLPDRSAGGQPLDLSQMSLRSVSPVHLEYLANMGVAASMSISIVAGGRLWGLIACHHREVRHVPPGVRAAADLFGLFVSMRVAAREQQEATRLEDEARAVRDALALRLSRAASGRAALQDELELVRRTVPSDGVALLRDGQWRTAGRTPPSACIAGVQAWLAQATGAGAPVATARAADWSTQDGSTDGIAGVLALPLDPVRGEWLLFFRCEEVEDVRWAGPPDEPFVIDKDGTRIGPRKSFAAWNETVRGASEPWNDAALRMAARLQLVLRDHFRDPGATGRVVEELRARRGHLDVHEHRSRLQQMSELLESLVHVSPVETVALAERISQLEEDLQRLVMASGHARDPLATAE
ncbi:GAF domain-containing protein [Luteimonas composti]|uniref:GAF domain-containing protein n=1 Tax=Luteimonas composti TaxID=398257 RepID=A0ABT6MNG8_9GAMM|nr:GAF domain-containing protein [Luteimonas composti]MDH7452137.1 GAF domain-containing protein [Luteimonas composti]